MDRIFFALSLGLAGLIASPLRAAPQCGPHDNVADELAKQYGEAPHAMGLAQDNTVMELYAAETGTWTLTVTLANGQTCLVAAGQNFETITETQPAKGDPA
jgi:hypothetical protein